MKKDNIGIIVSEYYNLLCPKGYGKITFIQLRGGFFCPVSGKRNCRDCYRFYRWSFEEKEKPAEKK